MAEVHLCPVCNGEGKLYLGGQTTTAPQGGTCHACHGTGYVVTGPVK